MSSDDPMTAVAETPHLVVPRARRRRRWPWATLTLLVVVPATIWAAGNRPSKLWPWARDSGEVLATVAVDRGDLDLVVVENGTVESSENAPVKCKVEALIGLVGGAQNAQGGNRAGGQQQGGGGGGGGGTRAGGNTATAQQQQQQQMLQQQQQAAQKKAATPKKGATPQKAKPGAAKASTAAGGAAGGGATQAAPAGGTGGAAGGAAAGGAGATATGVPKPVIQSFTLAVQPHVPLRPKAPAQAQTKQQAPPPDPRQGNNPMNQEKPGSTRIIRIVAEGSWVKEGDVVCELDASAFRDELDAQLIRYAEAKAWVEQAEAILRTSEIALREYQEGILAQDRLALKGYIDTCLNEVEQAKDRAAYARKIYAKGLMTSQQYQADEFALEKAKLAMREAERMSDRLEKFTGPKLVKNLQAKIEAVRADWLAQKSSFELEKQRKEKLEKMIEYCTMRAPREGLVVYVKPANAWGRANEIIQEGATVREGMAIFSVPDPRRMRVRAKINESKVAEIASGQSADVLTDAFPDRPFRGKVAEVTLIPAPSQGPISDVKIYYAMVDIDAGDFDGLRPGFSAEVTFHVASRHNVVRVPLRAIHWVGSRPYAALASGGGRFEWRRLDLGVSDLRFAEVVSGLEPGDRVVADPEDLEPPRTRSGPALAGSAPGPRG